MGKEDLNLFCTVTEFSRISGIPKKSLYNKEGKGVFGLVDVIRRGRRMDITERCIEFDDMVKLMPAFNSLYRSKLLSLFQVQGSGLADIFAFRIIDVVRILNLSKQVIHGRITSGRITLHSVKRNYRDFNEKCILGRTLPEIKNEPFNLKDRILELFMEKK